MAFLKSLLLYYGIIYLFLASYTINGLTSEVIKLSTSPLLNNHREQIISKNTRNLTHPNLIELETSSPRIIATKPERTLTARLSFVTRFSRSRSETLAGNPAEFIDNITDTAEPLISQQELANIAEYGDEFVNLPDLPCTINNDCTQWNSGAPMKCVDEQCVCPDTLCWNYQLQLQGDNYVNVFFCDECGNLGSSCESDSECDEPGVCWTDDFCHCDTGVNYYNICLVQVIGFTDNVITIILGTICLTLIFAFCIIAYKPNIYAYCWRTCNHINRDAEDQQNAAARRRTRRLRRHKSPAFTHTEIFRENEDQQSNQAHGGESSD